MSHEAEKENFNINRNNFFIIECKKLQQETRTSLDQTHTNNLRKNSSFLY
jgi:hypothetical protein